MRVRIASVLLALVLLSSSLALAQGTQRWQYAVLSIFTDVDSGRVVTIQYAENGARLTFSDPRALIDNLREFTPYTLAAPAIEGTPYVVEILNILGYGDWEFLGVTARSGITSNGITGDLTEYLLGRQ